MQRDPPTPNAPLSPSPVLDYLETLRSRLQDLSEGRRRRLHSGAGARRSRWFGICIATRDGFVYEVGDSGQPFTIQSVSKPLTYGLALEENGEDAVLAKIGVEPSGDAFNAISLQAPNWCPAQSADQCWCDRGVRPDPRRHRRTEDRAHPRGVFPVYRARRSTSTKPSMRRRARPGIAIARSPGCCAISRSSPTSRHRRSRPISANARSASRAATSR